MVLKNEPSECVSSPDDKSWWGLKPILWQCKNENGQTFSLQNGKICNNYQDCLSSRANSNHYKADIIQWGFNNEAGQTWKPHPNYNYHYVNNHGLCLSVRYDIPRTLRQYHCIPNDPDQEFIFL